MDYLTLCSENGITINEDKIQFCQDKVEFARLTISNDGITPSKSILAAISDFPTPTDITSARSWFGLVNQVSWPYSISPIIEPFRDLIKPNWYRDDLSNLEIDISFFAHNFFIYKDF